MLAAAGRGCVNIVSTLLSIGTDPNYCEDGGDPALFVALENGHLQVRCGTQEPTLSHKKCQHTQEIHIAWACVGLLVSQIKTFCGDLLTGRGNKSGKKLLSEGYTGRSQ